MVLISQQFLFSDDYQGPDWHRTVRQDLSHRLQAGSGFPCTFSQNAFRQQIIKFILIEDDSKTELMQLADGLAEYVSLSRKWDGKLSTAHPLVVAFSQAAIESSSASDYHSFGWKMLQQVHQLDQQPWPQSVSKDPHEPFWSMCFNGMQLFVNMSSPAHKIRKSRNLGAHFLMIINPRERFDIVAGDNPAGHKVRNSIRTRLEHYDQQPHSLQLGSYQAGDIEWWQYGIVEENCQRTDRCPFVFKGDDKTAD